MLPLLRFRISFGGFDFESRRFRASRPWGDATALIEGLGKVEPVAVAGALLVALSELFMAETSGVD